VLPPAGTPRDPNDLLEAAAQKPQYQWLPPTFPTFSSLCPARRRRRSTFLLKDADSNAALPSRRVECFSPLQMMGFPRCATATGSPFLKAASFRRVDFFRCGRTLDRQFYFSPHPSAPWYMGDEPGLFFSQSGPSFSATELVRESPSSARVRHASSESQGYAVFSKNSVTPFLPLSVCCPLYGDGEAPTRTQVSSSCSTPPGLSGLKFLRLRGSPILSRGADFVAF